MSKSKAPEIRPRWVIWLFVATAPILIAQFIYGSIVYKPYPGVVMPSFAKLETKGDSILRTTQHHLTAYPCDTDSFQVEFTQLFAGLSPIGARLIVDRVLFYSSLEERLTPERRKYYHKIERYTNSGVTDYIMRNRYPRVSQEDVANLDRWLRRRLSALYPNKTLCGAAIVRRSEIRNLVDQQVVHSFELDRYPLSYE